MTQSRKFDPNQDALRASDLPDPAPLLRNLTCEQVQEILRRREESDIPLSVADLSSIAAHITTCPHQQLHEV